MTAGAGWDGPPLEAWDAWTPWQAAERLDGLEATWCVVGGWAIDLALDRRTRAHDDLEVAVLRTDLARTRNHLGDLAFHEVGDGTVRRLGPDEPLGPAHHQTWGLEETADRWRIDLMAEPGDAETWVYRRDPTLVATRSWMVATTPEGIPHLRPHGVLLYKARAHRDKDQADFEAVVATLDDDARAWLRDALGCFHPGHPWITVLAS